MYLPFLNNKRYNRCMDTLEELSTEPNGSPWSSVSLDDLELNTSPKKPSQDPILDMWRDIDSPIIQSFNDAIDVIDNPSSVKETLNSSTAKSILPYLSLDNLSDNEKVSILSLSKAAVEQTDSMLMKSAYLFNILPDYLAAAGNESEAKDRGEISLKLGEARKLFCASLIDTFNKSDPNQRGLIHQAFFNSSPDYASYVGGLKGSLELLPLASRSGNNTIARNIYDEIRYDYSFANFNGYDNVFTSESNPIKQLQLIPIMYNVTLGCDPEGWNSNNISYISEALYHLSDNPSTTPLVRLVADSFDRKISDDLNTEWIFIDPDDPEYAELFKRDAEYRANIQAEQDALHQKYSSLPANQYLIEIAPNVAATMDRYSQLNLISNSAGEQASLLDYETDNLFNLDHNSALLLGTAHNPEVKPLIDSQLSLDLSSISLDAQVQLLKYMTEADSTRYENLCSTLKNTPPDLRLKLAESFFLASDFGNDLGDSLLTIANSDHFSSDQIADILISVDSCRSSIKNISNLYSQIDNGTFSEQYSRAANERLVDALTVFREIAEHGSAKADLDWAGQTDFTYESALEALNYEKDSLSIISGTMDDVISGKDGAFAEQVLSPDADHDRSLYNFYSPNHGYVLLYTRPEGSSTFDPMIEYGKFRSIFAEQNNNAGIEASISFITNPVNPFSLPNPYRPDRKKSRDPNYYDPPTMDKVSAIRLDREGRTPDTPPDDPNRSPIDPAGIVSVDLAAIGDRPDTPSGKSARLFSTGNKLREQSHNTDFNLNHNTHWFDQDSYGSSSGFKRLANYVQNNADVLCLLYPPSKDSPSFSSAFRSVRRSKRRQQSRPHHPTPPVT